MYPYLRIDIMKSSTLISLCLGSIFAFASPLSLADTAQSQPGQMYKVLTALQSKGYVIVKKVEFDKSKGDYMAKVVNAEGKNITLQINPQTGELTKEKGDITGWTAIEVAKKVEDAGYKNIYEINTEIFGNEYDVKVLNDKGEKVSLKVDVKSGNITKISD